MPSPGPASSRVLPGWTPEHRATSSYQALLPDVAQMSFPDVIPRRKLGYKNELSIGHEVEVALWVEEGEIKTSVEIRRK